MARSVKGRRLPDTPEGSLPDDFQSGDYWKVLDRETGEPKHSNSPDNLTGTVWRVVAPWGGVAGLVNHTVREHGDGTISVLPGDGSSNSILLTGAGGQQYHGYICHGEWE